MRNESLGYCPNQVFGEKDCTGAEKTPEGHIVCPLAKAFCQSTLQGDIGTSQPLPPSSQSGNS